MLSYFYSCQSCFRLQNNLISTGNQDIFFPVQGTKSNTRWMLSGFWKKKSNKNPYKSAYEVCIFPSVSSLKNHSLILPASERKIRMSCICSEWIIGQNLTIMNCYVENTYTVYTSICHNFSIQSSCIFLFWYLWSIYKYLKQQQKTTIILLSQCSGDNFLPLKKYSTDHSHSATET